MAGDDNFCLLLHVMYQIYAFGLYDMHFGIMRLMYFKTMGHMMYDVVGGYPKAYIYVLDVLSLGLGYFGF